MLGPWWSFKPHPEHRVDPHLLRGLEISQPGHVWCADMTYIPMRRGFLHLVAVMDGKGRWVDNVMIERLWRSPKYEWVHLNAFETGSQAKKGIGDRID